MRWRLSTLGITLLVMALVVSGLAGCSRSAERREASATEPPVTEEAEAPGAEGATPGPGETVVSVVTPVIGVGTPVAGAQPTEEPTMEPSTEAEAPTTEPAATLEPSPTTAAASDASGEFVWHTVQRGETVSSIALRYDTTTEAIARANKLSDASKIYTGQRLQIPTTGGSSSGSTGSTGSSSSGTPGCRVRHTVKRGEWVWQLARDYQVSPYAILEANNLTIKKANTIYPGQVLCIP